MRQVEQAGEDLQARFEREGLERCRRGARIFCGFVLALLLVSAAYSAFSEPGLFSVLLRIRLAAVAGVALVLGLLATPVGARRPREATLALMLLLTVSLHALAVPTGGQLSAQYDRMTFVILGPAILMSWGALWSLLGSTAVIGVYVGGSAAAGAVGTEPFTANLGRLLAATVVTVGASVFHERYRWRELWHLHALAEARQRADREIRRLNEELELRVAERTAELGASERRFRAMFEHAPIGIITVDPDGRLLQVNQAFAVMLGRSDAEISGESVADFTAMEDRARTLQAFRGLSAGEHAEFQTDMRYVRRDGTAVVAHEAVAAVRDAAGKFSYALGMVEDVTDRARAEENAREHQEQLAHVLRVSTMGEMAAQLAHELNQPLGAIVNYANGACTRLRDGGADAAIVDAVARIAGEGMRAGEILRRVRDFVRRSGGVREAIDVNHLVREATSLLEADMRRHQIPVRLGLDPSLPPVSLDRIQVEQVILNLMRNAIDAMSSSPRDDHELTAETSAAAGFVEVRVRDTGIGVAPGHAERIFDAFFTSKPGGLGMGLSISRSIVEAHGGRLWASRNPDRGMTFGFALATQPRLLAIGPAAGLGTSTVPTLTSGGVDID